VDFGA
jgi:hypothetical protein